MIEQTLTSHAILPPHVKQAWLQQLQAHPHLGYGRLASHPSPYSLDPINPPITNLHLCPLGCLAAVLAPYAPIRPILLDHDLVFLYEQQTYDLYLPETMNAFDHSFVVHLPLSTQRTICQLHDLYSPACSQYSQPCNPLLYHYIQVNL